MRIIDISQPVSPASAVFPGDTPFSFRQVMSMASGGSCDVGTITMSVHVGTHADAPGHFLPGGPSIADVDLSAYLGPVRVVEVPGAEPIDAERLRGLPLAAPRILLKTGSAPDPRRFSGDFAYLEPEAVRVLEQRGVRLVGVDTPSVDAADSKSLPSHKALARAGIAILENLLLEHVPAGDYELVALPLRLTELDASPVRAVLLVR